MGKKKVRRERDGAVTRSFLELISRFSDVGVFACFKDEQCKQRGHYKQDEC